MPITPRQEEILAAARTTGRVMVDDLAKELGVTVQTIRRDLGALCDAGNLDRIHGGAVLPSGVTNIGYEDRRRLNADAKEAIARATAEMIPEGASLFMNIGTTTEAVAQALLGHAGLMVITNNINVARILAGNPSAEVILTGGTLRRSDGGLTGDMAVQTIEQFRVDYAVIGASALDPVTGDLLDFDLSEVRVARAIVSQARQTILVADHGKLARSAPVRIGSLPELDQWVTDAPPPAALARIATDAGCTITIARDA